MSDENNTQWAIVDLMGHVTTAGRISQPGDWSGLLRIDVPDGETFRTEYYGITAIYSIKLVSEEIARIYAEKEQPIEYNAPIVTRAQHDNDMQRARRMYEHSQMEIEELRRRLTAVNGLPSGDVTHHYDDDDDDDDDQDEEH